MKTIKVAKATNTQLDWLVAKCEGHTQETVVFPNGVRSPRVFIADGGVAFDALTGAYLDFTTDWSQMGPIIGRELLDVSFIPGAGDEAGFWCANTPRPPTYKDAWPRGHGPTPLIAAARCYVVSKLGEEVEVPEELA